jgi:hypothetical protein
VGNLPPSCCPARPSRNHLLEAFPIHYSLLSVCCTPIKVAAYSALVACWQHPPQKTHQLLYNNTLDLPYYTFQHNPSLLSFILQGSYTFALGSKSVFFKKFHHAPCSLRFQGSEVDSAGAPPNSQGNHWHAPVPAAPVRLRAPRPFSTHAPGARNRARPSRLV